MASVNFKKLKNSGQLSGMLRHCDPEQRVQHEHKNKDIRPELSDQNENILGLNYHQTMARFKDRIEELDRTTNTNKRADRVECFGLEMTVPEGLSPDKQKEFLQDAVFIMEHMYGAKNMIGAYIHMDEVHEYMDHGEVKLSRAHLHAYMVPEVDGKLVGKAFSSKQRMQELNKVLDTHCCGKFGVPFMTWEKARKRTVEELKALSEKEVQQREEKIKYLDGEVKKRVELHDQRADKDVFGRQKETVTLPWKEYADLQATARKVKDVLQLEQDLTIREQQTAAEYKKAFAAKENAEQLERKNDMLRYEAQQMRDEEAQFIAQESQRIARELFDLSKQKEKDDKAKRLEAFCREIKFKDGSNIMEHFEEREHQLQKAIEEKARKEAERVASRRQSRSRNDDRFDMDWGR